MSDLPAKETLVPGTGRTPKIQDVVVINFEAFVCGTSTSIVRQDGVLHAVGRKQQSHPVPATFTDELLLSMQEGGITKVSLPARSKEAEQMLMRCGVRRSEAATVALDVHITLVQICVPGGARLQSPTSMGRGGQPEPLRRLVARCASELQEKGITVLQGPEQGGFTPPEVKLLREASLRFFDLALERMREELQRDPNRVIRFLDCVARKGHRLHVKPPDLWDPKVFGFLHHRGTFHEVLHRAFGSTEFRLTHCGALMAKPAVEPMPNNVNQSWHRDAPEEPHLVGQWDPYAAPQ